MAETRGDEVMSRHKLVALSVLSVAALAAGTAVAAPGLSTEYRYGSQVSEWFVRGDAATSQSQVFSGGLRLAAWDGQNEQELTRVAVATAVYFFQIPAQAQSVSVQVGYRADPAARNREVAGFLFARNQAIERQYAPLQDAATGAIEEPGFFGDTYVLPANQQQIVVNLPVADHVADGVLEVHLSAGAGQVFDVHYVQVASYGQAVPLLAEAAPTNYYMGNPYDYTYYYYYAGPRYFPRGGAFVRLYCFANGIDPFLWGGWASFRACFYTHHPWVYRPARFVHHRPLAIVRSGRTVRPHVDRHRVDWYRRNFGLERARLSEPEIHRVVRQRVHVVAAGRLRDHRDRALTVAEQVLASDNELRTQLGDARYTERLRTWQRHPAEARRELDRSPRTRVIRQAAAEWQAVRSGKPRTAVRQPVAPRPTAPTPAPPRTHRILPTVPNRTPRVVPRTTPPPPSIRRTSPTTHTTPAPPRTRPSPPTVPNRTPKVERRTTPQPTSRRSPSPRPVPPSTSSSTRRSGRPTTPATETPSEKQPEARSRSRRDRR